MTAPPPPRGQRSGSHAGLKPAQSKLALLMYCLNLNSSFSKSVEGAKQLLHPPLANLPVWEWWWVITSVPFYRAVSLWGMITPAPHLHLSQLSWGVCAKAPVHCPDHHQFCHLSEGNSIVLGIFNSPNVFLNYFQVFCKPERSLRFAELSVYCQGGLIHGFRDLQIGPHLSIRYIDNGIYFKREISYKVAMMSN